MPEAGISGIATSIHTHTHTYIYIYIYITYTNMKYVSVCVWIWKRHLKEHHFQSRVVREG